MAPLSRRQFLALTGSAGAVIGTGAWWLRDDAPAGQPAGPLAAETTTSMSGPPATARRQLVLVQLDGGNDGLNTVVPVDGRYRDARPTLGVPEADVVPLAGFGAGGLHPALAPLVPEWDAGRLAIVQSVGFEHIGRSHFSCRQHWWDGTDHGETSATGWLGRWLDETRPGGEANPLRAVAIGPSGAPLRGDPSTPAVVLDPATFGITGAPDVDGDWLSGALASVGDSSREQRDGADLVERARAATAATIAGADRLAPHVAGSPPQRSLTADLRLAGELLAADLGVDVVSVTASGFDTHAAQLDTHASLLGDLAGGLTALREVLVGAGAADRVLVLTTSEFGRRVAENGSAGTDHGVGGCQLLLGEGVAGASYGSLDLADLVDGDIRPTVDPRWLFAAALDWLGGPTESVLGTHDRLELLR